MKLGILNAIPADEEELLNVREIDSFRDLLDLAPGHTFELVEYRLTDGEFPDHPDACDAYLLTGSPSGVYHDAPWIPRLAEFVRAAFANRQKLVGICFGHQMLADALGGAAVKSDKGWGLGRREIKILETRPWMDPPLPAAALYFAHQDQVVALPDGGVTLASDPFCPNDMFVIGDQVLGIQGHPEFTRDFMKLLNQVLEPEVGSEVIAAARRSVQAGDTSSPVIARWIVNFLQNTASDGPQSTS